MREKCHIVHVLVFVKCHIVHIVHFLVFVFQKVKSGRGGARRCSWRCRLCTFSAPAYARKEWVAET